MYCADVYYKLWATKDTVMWPPLEFETLLEGALVILLLGFHLALSKTSSWFLFSVITFWKKKSLNQSVCNRPK